MMSEDACITLESMKDKLLIHHELAVSVTTVHNAIVGFAFSFKCLKIQCVAAVTEDLKQKRREYSRSTIS